MRFEAFSPAQLHHLPKPISHSSEETFSDTLLEGCSLAIGLLFTNKSGTRVGHWAMSMAGKRIDDSLLTLVTFPLFVNAF